MTAAATAASAVAQELSTFVQLWQPTDTPAEREGREERIRALAAHLTNPRQITDDHRSASPEFRTDAASVGSILALVVAEVHRARLFIGHLTDPTFAPSPEVFLWWMRNAEPEPQLGPFHTDRWVTDGASVGMVDVLRSLSYWVECFGTPSQAMAFEKRFAVVTSHNDTIARLVASRSPWPHAKAQQAELWRVAEFLEMLRVAIIAPKGGQTVKPGKRLRTMAELRTAFPELLADPGSKALRVLAVLHAGAEDSHSQTALAGTRSGARRHAGPALQALERAGLAKRVGKPPRWMIGDAAWESA